MSKVEKINVQSKKQEDLAAKFYIVRTHSLNICAPLEIEDYTVQPCEEVSPPKWHLAHTTWFFEEMILVPFCEGYKKFDDNFSVYFNSYYKKAGKHWAQGNRGQLSRPTVKEVVSYRKYVDDAIVEFLKNSKENNEVNSLMEIGFHHEQQHQELLLMDIKYILGANSSFPKYSDIKTPLSLASSASWHRIEEGVHKVGFEGDGFSFDNEKPRHKTFVQSVEVCTKLVTNGEFLEFIKSNGYKKPELWLSLGWDWINKNNIEMPLYWQKNEDDIYEFTLHGLEKLDLHAPVTHISYFEAEAYARWKEYRLPTEQEFEIFEREHETDNSLENSSLLHPKFANQKTGQVWCWTRSHYSPYPGFKSFEGMLSEYNGKFMCSQFVLRGGCVATPKDHYRNSYRNFYQPHQRWMFSGLRLARNV